MTHAEATRRARPGIPASDCAGALRRRKLRPKDWAWQCATCGAALWFDASGWLVVESRGGEPQRLLEFDGSNDER